MKAVSWVGTPETTIVKIEKMQLLMYYVSLVMFRMMA